MGNSFEITVVAGSAYYANECIDAAVNEIRRIEKLLTTFDDNSQTNAINKMAGIQPVKTDQEVFRLIQRSIRISDITQGAFDITYGSIDKRFWNFDASMTSLPSAKAAKLSVRLIDYRCKTLRENGPLKVAASTETCRVRERGCTLRN